MSSEILKQFERENEISEFKDEASGIFRIANESILTNDVPDKDFEGFVKYLEKKYLSSEFLFNDMDTNLLTHGFEHPDVYFELLINQVLIDK